jgi:hypothetical protein
MTASCFNCKTYLEGRTSWQDFMDQAADFEGDSLIAGFVDLIEHEPKRGGFMGLNEKEWITYQQSIKCTIEDLEK